MKDRPTSLVLPHHCLEVSLDYILMNDNIDVFDVKSDTLSGKSGKFASLGDLEGGRLIANYGLFPSTTLNLGYSFRNLDYGIQDFDIHRIEWSFRQNLLDRTVKVWPFIAFDLGMRSNIAKDQRITDPVSINMFVQRMFDNRFKFKEENGFIVIEDSDKGISFKIPKGKGPRTEVSLDHLRDYTFFARMTIGDMWGIFFPNWFLEYGHTEIEGEIDSSLKFYAQKAGLDLEQFGLDLPYELDRDEHYLSTGLSLLCDLPWNLQGSLEYKYLNLSRESSLDRYEVNHIFKAQLSYFLTEQLIFNIQGSFYQNQYNGIIPLLYNQYTESTFDNQYGETHIGFTYLFGQN